MPRTTASLVSLAAAAEQCSVSTKTIRRRISDGTLRAVRVGPRLIRVDSADLDRLFVEIPTARPSDAA